MDQKDNAKQEDSVKQIEKTLDELIFELREKMVDAVNDSGLPLSVTAMMMREFAGELSNMERAQTPKK